MRTYVRVTYRPDGEGRAKSIYVENPGESRFTVPASHDGKRPAVSEPVLTGRQVGKDGSSIIREGDRLVVIALETIVKRAPYEMDAHYGELVPLGTAKHPITPETTDA